MTELDPDYIAKLVVDAQNGASDAFAELFTATYEDQYRFICNHIWGRTRTVAILREVYSEALNRIGELTDPRTFPEWLSQISRNACTATSHNHEPIPLETPELDADEAGRLLYAVFAECDRTPSVIPVRAFENWGNYKKKSFRHRRRICYGALAFLAILPFCFVHPSLSAARQDTNSASSALYDIHVSSLLPTAKLTANLNGSALKLTNNGSGDYTAEITSNGVLYIKAVALNGQTATLAYDAYFIDSDKPALATYYTQDGLVYLVVRDAYSGINYDAITAEDTNLKSYTPVSFDKDSGTIAYAIPTTTLRVRIPDNAGNTLVLKVAPDNTVSAAGN